MAVNEISSSTRSITVCSRRAPIFSTLEFTATAMSAMASIASSVKSSVTPSVCISATYCLISEASVSVRMRRKSSRVSALQFDADRQPALQFGQQVRGLRNVERARRNEQNMVGLHRAVLGRDGGAFDQRQQIALHALARHVAAHAALARANLVELVEEDDAVLLHRLDRFQHQLVLIEQFVGFLVEQDFVQFRDRDAAASSGAPPSLPKMSPIEIAPICAPGMPGMSIIGMPPPPDCTSISISLSFSSPARNLRRKDSLVAGLAAAPTSASTTRSSAACCARVFTSLRFLSLASA